MAQPFVARKTLLFMAHNKQISAEGRMQSRAQLIAKALKRARGEHGLSLRKLAKKSKVGPSTLSRLENPKTAESPKVETLEALAVALDCSLCELLGETVEYHSLGDWPDTLKEVFAERGGSISLAERAWIESTLANLGLRRTRAGSDADSPEDDLGDRDFWEGQLAAFRKSKRWRIIVRLAGEGQILDADPELLSAINTIVNIGLR